MWHSNQTLLAQHNSLYLAWYQADGLEQNVIALKILRDFYLDVNDTQAALNVEDEIKGIEIAEGPDLRIQSGLGTCFINRFCKDLGEGVVET